MQYMLLIYGDQNGWESLSEEERGQIMQAYGVHRRSCEESGSMVAGDALQPTDTATTVRVRNDETLITDGPFAETKEQLGGYYIVDVGSTRRGDRVGGEDPRLAPRLRRGPAGDGLRGGRLVVEELFREEWGRTARDPRPRARRRRSRRGRGAGGLRGGARALAARRRPRQPRRLAADDGAQPRDRPDPARADARAARPSCWRPRGRPEEEDEDASPTSGSR